MNAEHCGASVSEYMPEDAIARDNFETCDNNR